ncbi:MAG: citramalate synthase, partial [Spirochaetes bacterium]|nr:citramalate synthase [Spirochaetota bacterium]
MNDKMITIYDTTLRDGAQTVGISFSVQDKLRISAELDRLMVDYIEGGWPGANPKDDLFFNEIRKQEIRHSKIAAFGSTRRPDRTCKNDEMLKKLVDSRADLLSIVAKTSDFQVLKALNIGLDENLDIIYESIAFLKDRGFCVFLDAE